MIDSETAQALLHAAWTARAESPSALAGQECGMSGFCRTFVAIRTASRALGRARSHSPMRRSLAPPTPLGSVQKE